MADNLPADKDYPTGYADADTIIWQVKLAANDYAGLAVRGDGTLLTGRGDLPPVASATNGFVVYAYAAAVYGLAPGQTENGVSPRFYIGSVDPSTVLGYVARVGDTWLETS